MPETRKLKTLPGPGGLLVGLSGGLERIRDLPAEPAGTLIRFRQQELAGSPELLHAVVLGANHHGPVGANGEGRDRPRHARQLAQVHGAVHVPDLEAAGARADDDVVVHHREPDAVRIPGHVEGRDERAVDSVHLDHRVQRACGDHGARRAEAAALYRPAMAGDGASQRILRSVWGDLVDLPQPERPVRPLPQPDAQGPFATIHPGSIARKYRDWRPQNTLLRFNFWRQQSPCFSAGHKNFSPSFRLLEAAKSFLC
mmetsp:Transcript_3518/g.10232  ORF Transcript_3518/g.10232 Transcript_3518/m.10232 type:complete len:256 (+) Transcript_3518:257-1024(+)